MKEILGYALSHFLCGSPEFMNCEVAKRTYRGNRYEVWEVSDEMFDKMCSMTEERFVELAGEEAWWLRTNNYIFVFSLAELFLWRSNREHFLSGDYDLGNLCMEEKFVSR